MPAGVSAATMFEGWITPLLMRLLGDYVEAHCFDPERLHIDVWSGAYVQRATASTGWREYSLRMHVATVAIATARSPGLQFWPSLTPSFRHCCCSAPDGLDNVRLPRNLDAPYRVRRVERLGAAV